MSVPPTARFAIRYLLASILLLAAFRTLFATPGQLDPTFDDDGLVVGYPGDPHGLAVQPDGKIVVVAKYWAGSSSGSTLRRFRADGQLDPTFVGNGAVDTTFGPEAVALDSVGRILVAGTIGVPGGSDFVVARYDPNGTPDHSFGVNGKAAIDFGSPSDLCYDLAVDAAGRIVVAGSTLTQSSAYDFAVGRLDANGAIDRTFGGDGTVTTDFAGATDGAVGVAIDAEGRIVAAGSANTGSGEDFVAARYASDGTLDPAFGGDGRAAADFPASREIAEAMALDHAGGVVVAGATGDAFTARDFALVRFDADGLLDPAFGMRGMESADFYGMEDGVQGVTVDPAGRIVAFGRAQTSPGYADAGFALALARYTGEGLPDPSFGVGGRVTTSLADPMAWWGTVAIDPAGRIVVAGTVDHTFVLARYVSDDLLAFSTIDIRPGDPGNVIALSATVKKVEVAILSAEGADAPARVVPSSLTFGRMGDERTMLTRKYGEPDCRVRDVNGDGRADLSCWFLVKRTGLQPGDREGVLRGTTVDGAIFEDRDMVTITP